MAWPLIAGATVGATVGAAVSAAVGTVAVGMVAKGAESANEGGAEASHTEESGGGGVEERNGADED